MAQLSAADGVVECGYCGQQLNTIERLHAKPLVGKSTEIPQDVEEQAGDAEPQFDIPITVDESINIFKGMIPSIPVHFVLEVTGSTEEAVSFEFDFL